MALITGAPYHNVTHKVIGCAMRVHSALGPGLLENPCKEALASEMSAAGLHFQSEVRLPCRYRNQELGHAYYMDFVVEDLVVVEVKSVARLLQVHKSQLTSYLKFSGHPAGLLLNFNVASMRHGIVRVLNDRSRAPDDG